MKVVRTVAELREALPSSSAVGLVPTMGALHAGHVALLETARGECDFVVMSLFVNVAQFDSDADFARTGTHAESGPYGVEDWLRIYARHAHEHADQIRRAGTGG